jgi:hypothetical protein
LTKDAAKDAWKAQKYSPPRRSRLYTIGVSLVMAGDTPYRATYLARKDYERKAAEAQGLTVAPAGKIPRAQRAACRSLGHIDNRARRYVEKRLLRDLWNAWREAKSRVPQGQLERASRHAPPSHD